MRSRDGKAEGCVVGKEGIVVGLLVGIGSDVGVDVGYLDSTHGTSFGKQN